ncbi:MAG: competence/damage-inducible protein CinA [Armatimonadetes bacterium]|jgi:nicotinamide-nucleotide amidase|nr:competence/damage-inducible protein CinA [Armatimonadota bacterium]
MVAEILSVGTELLLGQIVDSNAAYLGRTLAGLGIDLFYKSTVGDNEGRVIDTLRRARDRADLIITSGGLGPTEDDLTKECIAQVFDEELVLHEPSLEQIRAFFARRGVTNMPERNAKQALIYRSGRMLHNPNGTAPGALLEKDGKIVISLPGPPNEMIPMVENHVVPLLTERLEGKRQYLVTRVVRFIGIGESAVEEQVQDLIHGTNPSLAPLAHTGEVHLRIGAKAESPEAAEALIVPLEAELRRRLARFIYGVDRTTLEAAVIELLKSRGRTVACAESCTGGGLGARLTSVSGSSAAFLGGVVTYSNDAKVKLLGVDPALLETHGAVSAPVAEAMARGVQERLGADLAVSITGVAGPDGGTAEKPVGLVYVGVATPERVFAVENHFIGIREDVRRRSTQVALQLLREELLRGS